MVRRVSILHRLVTSQRVNCILSSLPSHPVVGRPLVEIANDLKSHASFSNSSEETSFVNKITNY